MTSKSILPKRKLSEIQARYELEPTLNDVYLEGVFDKEIFDSVFQHDSSFFRPTYVIDDIEIDNEVLKKYNLTSGNRQRVIALAEELSLPDDTLVRFIVDRDFENWLPAVPKKNGLVLTKYCDVEIVFFHTDFVKQVLIDASRCKILVWEDFFEAAKLCLREVFCLRLELAMLKMNVSLIDFRKCLKIIDGVPKLNTLNLISRSLSFHPNNPTVKLLYERLNERLDDLREQPYQLVSRGHDFVLLLSWCIKNTKGLKSFQNEEAITRLLVLFAKDEKDELLYPITKEGN